MIKPQIPLGLELSIPNSITILCIVTCMLYEHLYVFWFAQDALSVYHWTLNIRRSFIWRLFSQQGKPHSQLKNTGGRRWHQQLIRLPGGQTSSYLYKKNCSLHCGF